MKKMVVLFFFLFAGSVNAGLITLDTVNNGWYKKSGDHSSTNKNTLTGFKKFGKDNVTNSFYLFDVSSLANIAISSVELTFYAGNGKYWSVDAFETLEIWSVDASLEDDGIHATGVDRERIYRDLMSGTMYGQVDVYGTLRDLMPEVSLVLSDESIRDILDDDFFSVGASISTLALGKNQTLWAGSGSMPAAYLTIVHDDHVVARSSTGPIAVPEPASLALMMMGLVGSGLLRRKKQEKNSV